MTLHLVKDEIKALRDQLIQSESENRSLQAECTETGRKLDELITDHRALQNKLKLISDENLVKQSTFAKNNEQYQLALESVTDEKEQLQSELDRIETEFEAVQEELRQSKKDLDTYQSRYNDLLDSIEQEKVALRAQSEEQSGLVHDS